MSAEGGCEICSTIWDSTKWQNFPDPESIPIFISVLVPMLSTAASFEVHARPPHWIRPMDMVLCTIKGRLGRPVYWDFRKEECPLPRQLGLKRKVAPRPDSEECFNLARGLLLDCATTHRHCKRLDNVPLPTRVIDVGPKDGSQEPALVIPGSALGNYATLSHCWGRSERLKTTSINLNDHLQAIPLKMMAQNFRDAVHITHQLNIRYLWIDSFCILQDSTEDWRAESRKMASVYKNSYVTIAAMDSWDSNIGIFSPRRKVIWPIQLTLKNGKDIIFGITSRETEFYQTHHFTTRGWVLQEFFLSPALLQYSTSQITWACHTYRTQEDECFDVITEKMRGPFEVPYIKSHWKWNSSFGDPSAPYFAWLMNIGHYSGRYLTVKADRLPAILAIVEVFSAAFRSLPLAGLWYEDLHGGLLWFREKKASLARKYPCYTQPRVPSWSWIAIDEPICFFYWPGQNACHGVVRTWSNYDMDLVDAGVIDFKDQSIRESIKAGFIQLWGVVVCAKCYTNHLEAPTWASEGSIRKSRSNKDMTLRCVFDTDNPRSGSWCYCVRIANWTIEHHMYPDNPCLAYFLILERTCRPWRPNRHPSDLGKFRRIGIGSATVDKADEFFGKPEKRFLTLY